MVRTLSERLRIHEQRRARLAEAEAQLKLDERKHRTRHLIDAGALAEKAGLLGLDSSALYGALLSLRDGAADTKQVEQWTARGNHALASETKLRDRTREPLLIIFDQPPTKAVAASLRKAGFRFSRVMQHWEGLARPDEAEALAVAHGGRVRCVPRPNGVLPSERPAAETVL
jgi:hypothetical protein